MTQLSLFDPDPDSLPPDARPDQRPRSRMARASDPATSHEAAAKAERSGKIEANRKLILAAVWKYPGLTSEELAGVTGLDRVEVARRMSELEGTAKVKPGSPPFPALISRGPARKPKRAGGKTGNPGVTWYPVLQPEGPTP